MMGVEVCLLGNAPPLGVEERKGREAIGVGCLKNPGLDCERLDM